MSFMDWLGFITGVICVYLIVKEKDHNWPIGILNSAILLYVFYKAGLFAQVGLQAFYVVECVYGWWMWTRRNEINEKVVVIEKANMKQIAILFIIGIIAVVGLTPYFASIGDPAPFWDSVIAIASLIAEYMLAVKLIESWNVYFAADIISIILLFSQGMYVTLATYICFTILTIMGFIEWRRTYLKRKGAVVNG